MAYRGIVVLWRCARFVVVIVHRRGGGRCGTVATALGGIHPRKNKKWPKIKMISPTLPLCPPSPPDMGYGTFGIFPAVGLAERTFGVVRASDGDCGHIYTAQVLGTWGTRDEFGRNRATAGRGVSDAVCVAGAGCEVPGGAEGGVAGDCEDAGGSVGFGAGADSDCGGEHGTGGQVRGARV